MSTINELLAKLNDLRARRNQPALASWEGTEKALTDTIAQYEAKKVPPAVAEGAYQNGRQAEASTELKGTHAKKREAIKKANEKKPTGKAPAADKIVKGKKAKAAPVAKPKGDFVSLADIARSLEIEPKLARAKARRSEALLKLCAEKDAWVFNPKDVAQVKKLLKGK